MHVQLASDPRRYVRRLTVYVWRIRRWGSNRQISGKNTVHQIATAVPYTSVALPEIPDEKLARHSAVRLLITASAQGAAEVLARRIHDASPRAELPFVKVLAEDLPGAPDRLRNSCSLALDAAAGGTLLISDVEQLNPLVQERLLEMLQEHESVRAPAAAVRLISATTVSLLDRLGSGRFCERLFYRLNIIHLTV